MSCNSKRLSWFVIPYISITNFSLTATIFTTAKDSYAPESKVLGSDEQILLTCWLAASSFSSLHFSLSCSTLLREPNDATLCIFRE